MAILIACTVSNTANADLTTGLIAHWSFDDCTAKDNSGNGHNGVIHGTLGCVDSVNGKGLVFNGSSYITIPETTSNIINPSQTSIVLLVKKQIGQTGASQHLISKHLNSSDVAGLVTLDPDGKYDIEWTIGNKFYQGANGATGLASPTGKFDLLVATYDSASIKLYFNGQLIKSITAIGLIANNSYDLTIGATSRINQSQIYGFVGSMDEVRIYNRALTDTEIATLAGGVVTTTPVLTGSTKALKFGQQPVGQLATQTVTLSNTGTGTLDIGALNLNGDADFTLDTNSCNNAHLVKDATCEFTVAFNPAGVGAKSGYVDVPSNVAGSPTKITLTGGGVPLPTITSITPIVAIINQPTTFTVTGTDLTDGMGFTVSDCEAPTNNVEVIDANSSDIQRRFKCTPRGKDGLKTGLVKTKPSGTQVSSFVVKIRPATLPIIVDVNPKKASINIKNPKVTPLTKFTVTGGNLQNGMGFAIADCEAPAGETFKKINDLTGTFSCRPRGTTGRKVGVVKTAPGGLAVYYFDVVVGTAPAADWLGDFKYNASVKNLSLLQLKAITDTSVTVTKSATTTWKVGTIFRVGNIIRKVNSMKVNANSTVMVSTAALTQDELFKVISSKISGKKNVFIPLTSGNFPLEATNQATGAKMRLVTSSSKNPMGLRSISRQDTADTIKVIIEKEVVYDFDGNLSTKLDQIILDGDFTLVKPGIKLIHNIGLTTRNVTLDFSASEEVNLTLSSATFAFKKELSIPIGEFAVPIAVTGGAVVVRGQLFIEFDASGKAKITSTFHQNASINFRTFAGLKKIVYVMGHDNEAKIHRIPDQHPDQLHLL